MKGKMNCAMPLLMLGSITLTANAATNVALNKAAIENEAVPVLISGKVCDANGEPIIGASIKEKGMKNVTISDIDGNFHISLLNHNAELEISYIGFTPQTVKAYDGIIVTMKDDTHSLNELVVVGYQTMRKTDLVGAVSSIKASELNTTTPTIGQSLVGKVSGVQISQVSGAPYQSTKIRVRGTASINASSDPLYVIDGYPSSGDLLLDPEDIASIEVLKDAASAAIYGSRAAGGVVLITTKRGKEGKTRVGYDFQLGINQLAKKVDLLNANQFADLVVRWSQQLLSSSNAKQGQNLGRFLL